MIERDPMFAKQKSLPLRVLSGADWDQWRARGYVIVRDAISPGLVENLRRAIWDFCELDPDAPEGWRDPSDIAGHRLPELRGSGMVEMYHHQAMWDARQSPRVYDAFVDIWDREDLWVNPNRANLLLPSAGEKRFDGFVHWDIDTSQRPLPFRVQGVLSLVDTSPEIGGTWGYPTLYENFDRWVAEQPEDRDPFRPDPSTVGPPEFLQVNAGDLLIFNSLLAHGVAPNRSADRARMAMYISMAPHQEDDEELVRQRIETHLARTTPKPVYPGDPRGWEAQHYGPAKLTELGQRLLGMRSWQDKGIHKLAENQLSGA